MLDFRSIFCPITEKIYIILPFLWKAMPQKNVKVPVYFQKLSIFNQSEPHVLVPWQLLNNFSNFSENGSTSQILCNHIIPNASIHSSVFPDLKLPFFSKNHEDPSHTPSVISSDDPLTSFLYHYLSMRWKWNKIHPTISNRIQIY